MFKYSAVYPDFNPRNNRTFEGRRQNEEGRKLQLFRCSKCKSDYNLKIYLVYDTQSDQDTMFSVNDIQDQSRFRHLFTLPHHSILDFVITNIKKPSWISISFLILNIFLILAFLSDLIYQLEQGNFQSRLFWISLGLSGLVFLVVIIPLHEIIHLVSMRISGAKKLRLKPEWKKLMVYATAHHFVTNNKVYQLIAWGPFVIFSAFFIILLWYSPPGYRFMIWFCFFLHTNGCTGDMSIINYLYLNRDKEIYSYDDLEQKESYFYEKI